MGQREGEEDFNFDLLWLTMKPPKKLIQRGRSLFAIDLDTHSFLKVTPPRTPSLLVTVKLASSV